MKRAKSSTTEGIAMTETNPAVSAVLESTPEPTLLHVPVKQPALPLVMASADGDFVALPPNWTTADLEKYQPHPRRLTATVRISVLADYLDYLNRYKLPNSIVLLNGSIKELGNGAALATTTIDYHVQPRDGIAGLAQFGTHVVSYHPQPSPAYALLCEIDDKLLDQDVFAQRLRDLSRFCVSHAAAELLEVIRTLTLTSAGDYQSHNDDISGSVRLRYNVQVNASAGTSERALVVPSQITFKVPVFLGDADACEIVADLVYRTPPQSGGKVRLGIRMPERLWLEYELINRLGQTIRNDTGLLVAVGSK